MGCPERFCRIYINTMETRYLRALRAPLTLAAAATLLALTACSTPVELPAPIELGAVAQTAVDEVFGVTSALEYTIGGEWEGDIDKTATDCMTADGSPGVRFDIERSTVLDDEGHWYADIIEGNWKGLGYQVERNDTDTSREVRATQLDGIDTIVFSSTTTDTSTTIAGTTGCLEPGI